VFDLTFSGLIPKFRFAFHKSLSKSTTKNVLTQVHDIEAFQSECTYLPCTRLAFFRIHVFIRVLAPLSALSFASAFNWTRGFHWLGVPFGGLQLPYFIFLLVILFFAIADNLFRKGFEPPPQQHGSFSSPHAAQKDLVLYPQTRSLNID
jgi:hypothetical protein